MSSQNVLPEVSSGTIAFIKLYSNVLPDDYSSAKNTDLSPQNLSFAEIAHRLSTCTKGGKHLCYFIRGGELKLTKANPDISPSQAKGRDHYHRNDDSLLSASILPLDIDYGPAIEGTETHLPPSTPLEMHQALKELGITHHIYTTHSHIKGEKIRYRVIIPASRLYARDELQHNLDRLLDIIESQGILLKRVGEMSVWSQPWFIPTRQDPNDGHFETYTYLDGQPFKIDDAPQGGSHYSGLRGRARQVKGPSGFSYGYTKDISKLLERITADSLHEPVRQAIMEMVRQGWTDEQIHSAISNRASQIEFNKDSAYVEAELSEDEIDRSIVGAIVRIEEESADTPNRHTATRYPNEPVSLMEASLQVSRCINDWISYRGPDKHAINVSLGVGKSKEITDSLRAYDGLRPIALCVRTNKEADGYLQDINMDQIKAIHIRGRRNKDDPDKSLCNRHEEYHVFEEHGISKFFKQKVCAECEFYPNEGMTVIGEYESKVCGYYQQFDSRRPIRIFAQAYLRGIHQEVLPKGFRDLAVGLIIDEDPSDSLMESGEHRFDVIARMNVPSIFSGDKKILPTIIEKIDEGLAWDDPFFQDRKLRADFYRELRKVRSDHLQISSNYGDVVFSDSDRRWNRVRSRSRSRSSIRDSVSDSIKKRNFKIWENHKRLYEAVRRWLRGDFNSVWIENREAKKGGTDRTDGTDSLVSTKMVCFSYKHKLPPTIRNRVLLCDGTLNEDIAKSLVGDDLHCTHIHVKQNVEIMQVMDQQFGKLRLEGKSQRHGESSDMLLARACAIARITNSPIICNKDALARAIRNGWLDKDHPHMWFNAIRSRNDYVDFDSMIIIGRPMPRIESIESKARGLWPRTKMQFTDDLVLMTDGIYKVYAHPDPLCDSVLRMIRENEVEQAIGRLRATRKEGDAKRILLATSTPIKESVYQISMDDFLLDSKDRARGKDKARLSQFAMRFDHCMPLSPKEMSRIAPDLWETEQSAKNYIQHIDTYWINVPTSEESSNPRVLEGRLLKLEERSALFCRGRGPGPGGGGPGPGLFPLAKATCLRLPEKPANRPPYPPLAVYAARSAKVNATKRFLFAVYHGSSIEQAILELSRHGVSIKIDSIERVCRTDCLSRTPSRVSCTCEQLPAPKVWIRDEPWAQGLGHIQLADSITDADVDADSADASYAGEAWDTEQQEAAAEQLVDTLVPHEAAAEATSAPCIEEQAPIAADSLTELVGAYSGEDAQVATGVKQESAEGSESESGSGSDTYWLEIPDEPQEQPQKNEYLETALRVFGPCFKD